METKSHAAPFVDRLRSDGYCIIEGALSTSVVEALAAELDPQFSQTEMSEGPFSGNDTRRFGRL